MKLPQKTTVVAYFFEISKLTFVYLYLFTQTNVFT